MLLLPFGKSSSLKFGGICSPQHLHTNDEGGGTQVPSGSRAGKLPWEVETWEQMVLLSFAWQPWWWLPGKANRTGLSNFIQVQQVLPRALFAVMAACTLRSSHPQLDIVLLYLYHLRAMFLVGILVSLVSSWKRFFSSGGGRIGTRDRLDCFSH